MTPSTPARREVKRARRGQMVYWWVSASDLAEVKFVKWVRTRMQTGRDDTNKIGIGAIVSSTWRFSRAVRRRINSQCKRGQALVRPYMSLYHTELDARSYRNPIPKPNSL